MSKKLLFICIVLLVVPMLFVGCGSEKVEPEYVILEESLADEEYGIGFRKGDIALAEEVQIILSEMKVDGTLAEISVKWFGEDKIIVGDSFSPSGQTDSSLENIKTRGTFILGLDDSFPPMGYRDDNNEIVGFDIDIATEMCKRMGVELQLQPISWDAKEQELSSGNIDCIWNGFTITEARKEALYMTEPYLINRQVVVTLSDSGIEALSDLAGKSLVMQAGSSAALALDEHPEVKDTLKDGRGIEVKDNVTAMFDLKAGGSDAVLMDEVVARYYLEHQSK